MLVAVVGLEVVPVNNKYAILSIIYNITYCFGMNRACIRGIGKENAVDFS